MSSTHLQIAYTCLGYMHMTMYYLTYPATAVLCISKPYV